MMTSKESITQNNSHETEAIDATLLAGCRAGDRVSQHRLYELSHQRVYRISVRIVGLQDAADVTQQVFLQVFRKIDQFKGDSKFETWLYRLSVNESLQYLRRERRWEFQAFSIEPMDQRKSEEQRSEQQEFLEQALSKIEPELRSIFVLKEVEELSYREIADILEIPEGTVGSRLNRARRELQQHLNGLGWEQ